MTRRNGQSASLGDRGGPLGRRSAPEVVVVGGGLAGIAAALDCADAGAAVTLVDQRRHLGGLTWSFERAGRQIDGGQHVFLRCCSEYRRFLRRIGSDGDVYLQDRLEVTVLRPRPASGGEAARSRPQPPASGRLRRSRLPAPLHLAASLLAYPHLGPAERLRLVPAAMALRHLDLSDPALDEETFADWLGRHGQGPAALEALWDLVTLPTVNLSATQASAAMGAMVWKTGVLQRAGAADIGWSRIPLGVLHGQRAAAALHAAGVEVRLGEKVIGIEEVGKGPAPRWTVHTRGGPLAAKAVVVALGHLQAAHALPAGTLEHQDLLGELGVSPIIDVHLLYERPVTDLPIAAALGTTAQWIFDRTRSSGLSPGPRSPQYLAVSISGAAAHMAKRPGELAGEVAAEVATLLPAAKHVRVLDALVTKEKAATFAAVPGTAALRPRARTKREGLFVAGAWTDTGWPATMEGAVRSGRAAAAAVLSEAHMAEEEMAEVTIAHTAKTQTVTAQSAIAGAKIVEEEMA